MELILIACSNSKREGGIRNYQLSSLQRVINEGSFKALQINRQYLASELRLPVGQDIGAAGTNQIQLMPAFERYSGRVYQRSDFQYLFPRLVDKKVLIVSAFYGILEACDFIRDYNLEMNSTIRKGYSLKSFWKDRELGKILNEFIEKMAPDIIHDLLPEPYRYALQPFIDHVQERFNANYYKYEYPGMGTGALWMRGDDLKKIL